MLDIILNIVGIILIIYSIYVIKKDFSKDKSKELSSTDYNINKNYNYNPNNQIDPRFNDIVDLKVDKIKAEEEEIKANKKDKNNKVKIDKLDKKVLELENTNKKIEPVHKKILELLEIGLTKEEIAKRLNKGIREVEIIIKIYKK